MADRDAIASIEELHRRLEPCRLCVKAGIRVESMPVFSHLHRADAILVGQAPGIREAVDRRPFIGPAGRRLRQWLEPAGLGTEEAFYGRLYIAAVAKCFPGKRPGGSDVRPSAAMVRTCRPWLLRELELVDAPLVVAVGTLALAEVAPGVALEDAVGVELRFADGRPLVALPHPSGANPWPHLPGNAPRLAQALELLADRLGRPA
jgi:uracil-DNA glycosylase